MPTWCIKVDKEKEEYFNLHAKSHVHAAWAEKLAEMMEEARLIKSKNQL